MPQEKGNDSIVLFNFMAITVGLTKSWVNKFGLVRLIGIGGFLLICWLHL